IRKGMTLIDCSTGNGGAALAWIGREKGYKIIVFMPEGMTDERKQQILSFGADIIETPKETFLMGAAIAADEYRKKHPVGEVCFLDQSSTLLNKSAWHACGQEIVSALHRQRVVPDLFICSIGTGGTFCGIADILRREYKNIKTIGIEVDRSAPLYASRRGEVFEHKSHNLMGLGAGVLSVNTIPELIDEVRVVDGHAAWDRMKKFIAEYNFGIGPTCGANLMVCEDVARLESGKNIVTLFFDSAWKYESRWEGVYPDYAEAE
ncbi:pyridoxal-phosphate dependent enzyme, partial [Pseudomonas sp. CCC3.1]